MTTEKAWQRPGTSDCSNWRGDPVETQQLLAVRILEKLQLIPPTDLTRHGMRVEGVKRLSAPNVAPRVFAKTGDLEFLGRHRDHWSWARLFFLSTCAIGFRMRSGDSESVTWRCIGEGGWLEFFNEKNQQRMGRVPPLPIP